MVTSPDHQRHDDGRGISHTASEPRTSYSTVLRRDAPEGVGHPAYGAGQQQGVRVVRGAAKALDDVFLGIDFDLSLGAEFPRWFEPCSKSLIAQVERGHKPATQSAGEGRPGQFGLPATPNWTY
ncbi:hypothetical protein ACQP1V_23670 [Microtetraspora malaysiensis]|uniref:hypothetical protein n=1 Tax=Microtetraspora malaysiensis TaxID=161358 RepID=UPI003D8E4F28